MEQSFPYRDVTTRHNTSPKEFYDILPEELGRGSYGTVYLCKERSTGLELAAKFVKCARKEERRNMEREIDIMKSLQHPRLIQLYDSFDDGNTITVILEL